MNRRATLRRGREQRNGANGGTPNGEWTAEQQELLQALAEQLGVALEGGRLYRETQRRAAREQVIGQVTGRIRESLDLETMLRTATVEIRQALNLGDLVVRLAAPQESAQIESAAPKTNGQGE